MEREIERNPGKAGRAGCFEASAPGRSGDPAGESSQHLGQHPGQVSFFLTTETLAKGAQPARSLQRHSIHHGCVWESGRRPSKAGVCLHFFLCNNHLTFLASHVPGLTVDQVLVSTKDIFLKLHGRGWQAGA